MELENLLEKLKLDHLENQLDAVCEQAAQRQLDYKNFRSSRREFRKSDITTGMRHPIYVRKMTKREKQALQAGVRSKDPFVIRRSQIVLASARG